MAQSLIRFRIASVALGFGLCGLSSTTLAQDFGKFLDAAKQVQRLLESVPRTKPELPPGNTQPPPDQGVDGAQESVNSATPVPPAAATKHQQVDRRGPSTESGSTAQAMLDDPSLPNALPLKNPELYGRFRGIIIYRGTFSGSAMHPAPEPQVSGEITLVLEFPGYGKFVSSPVVKGTYELTGTRAFRNSGKLTGSNYGGICKLSVAQTMEGKCDGVGFAGRWGYESPQTRARARWFAFDFETVAVKAIDFDERDRLALEASVSQLNSEELFQKALKMRPSFSSNGGPWLDLMRRSADAGHQPADIYLGDYFSGGTDRALAKVYLQKAADAGHMRSMVMLGDEYYYHDKDYSMARMLWQKAVDAHFSLGYWRMARLHRDGRGGFKQDFGRARELFNKTLEVAKTEQWDTRNQESIVTHVNEELAEMGRLKIGERGFVPGTPLTQKDAACLQETVKTERVSRMVAGKCIEMNGGRCGEYEKVEKYDTHRKIYNTNICSRAIRFRIVCGNAQMGEYLNVNPTETVQLAFGPPCTKNY